MENGRCVQFFATFAISLGTMTIGVTSTWPTPVLSKFKNKETDFIVSESEFGWMLSISPPGFVVGSFITRFISDRSGRRSNILFSALPYACGTLIAAFTSNIWMLCIMNFLWGVGTGMISTVISIYLAEIADKEIRGSLAAATRFMTNLGSLLMMSIGPFMSYKILNYCMILLPILFFVFCLCIPESPYYYLKEGKVDEAKGVLLRLRNDSVEAESELELMKADVKKEMIHSSSVLELLSGIQYRSAIIIAVGLKVSQIFTGGTTITQYLAIILLDAEIQLSVSNAMIIFASVKFIVGIMSSVLADRVGRRPLLFYSFIGNSISLVAVAIYFLAKEVLLVDKHILNGYSWIPLAGIIASNVISTLGFNAIIGMVQAEIFPLNVKAVAMTSLNVLGGCFGFAVAKAYQAVKDRTGAYGVFWVFSAVSLCGAMFTLFFVPETRGKSLREIQDLLQGVKNAEEIALNDVHSHAETNEAVCLESKEQTKL